MSTAEMVAVSIRSGEPWSRGVGASLRVSIGLGDGLDNGSGSCA